MDDYVQDRRIRDLEIRLNRLENLLSVKRPSEVLKVKVRGKGEK